MDIICETHTPWRIDSDRSNTDINRCLTVLVGPQRSIYPFLHFKFTVRELAKIHACMLHSVSIFIIPPVRINRRFIMASEIAEESKRPRLEACSERALHYVSPGEVITADTGFMRCSHYVKMCHWPGN